METGIQLTEDHLQQAVLGGLVLGGGGGGAMEEGLRLGREALSAGAPTLIPVDALDTDHRIATVSLVGAPASPEAVVLPADYIRAWHLLAELSDAGLAGVISSENGAVGTVNGWLHSAVLGIPVVDAPADGRAHPTNEMGSMGLERVSDYTSHQAAAGGDRHRGAYLEQQVRGSVSSASRLIRNAAELAGGLVAVARNPVSAVYLRANAAIGALSQALALGKHLCRGVLRGADWAIQALKEQVGASLVGCGVIEAFTLKSRDGYDVGFVRAGGLELTIWNEYITLDEDGTRRATFPDLIVTIDLESGLPLTSGQLAVGRRIAVLAAPSDRIVLGAGLRARQNYLPLEAAVGREIIRFAFPAGEVVN